MAKSLSASNLKAYPPNLLQQGKETLNALLNNENGLTCILSSKVKTILEKVLPLSVFIKNQFQRNLFDICEILKDDLLFLGLSKEDIETRAKSSLKDAKDEAEFSKKIRLLRNQIMVRIALRDIAGISTFSETCMEISSLASVCLEQTLCWLEDRMAKEFGYPADPKGKKIRLIVLGMGKLGAGELNFSSDIDIIFAYPIQGKTIGGKRSVSNEEYFLNQTRRLIQILSKNTPEGFVFRVDTRLRPFGDAGPLVMSAEAMAEYYENHGRQWERYAFVKAAPVAGDLEEGRNLLEALRPFVYRKYIDYSTIEALKEMKAMIVAEQAGKAGPDNVKLGPGGIRDIEFIVQTFQLLKGGRIKALQTPKLLEALEVIKELGLLDADTCRYLGETYVFLRIVENRLQEYGDMQVQLLPKDEERRLKLAVSLGYPSWDEFHKDYLQKTAKTSQVFKGLFQESDSESGSESNGQKDEKILKAVFVWTDPDDKKAIETLRDWGFQSPEETASLIKNFKDSKKVRALSGQVRELLDNLMPRLLLASAKTNAPDKALKQVLDIFEAVLKRTIYLVLLNQNPAALEHLVYLCSKSRLIAQLITRQPILLDELVSGDSLFKGSTKKELKKLLATTIDALSRKDLEHWLDELRRFKKANILRIAASQLKKIIPIDRVSIELANLAEILLAEVFEGALEDMLPKAPSFIKQPFSSIQSGLAIVAYGRLGSKEMTYLSDLDLVFLYDPNHFGGLTSAQKAELSYFYSRLVQRLIFFLSTRTTQGILYEIDTRLRPNGSQGVLVSTLKTFEEYQTQKAWTWEHQALIKARFICGDEKSGIAFEKIRHRVLTQKRNPDELKTDVLEMRNKIRESLKLDPDLFHIKKSPGGLVDIEFIVQFLVLKHASQEPSLTKHSNTIKLLELLGSLDLLADLHSKTLIDAFQTYQEYVTLKGLDLEEPIISLSEVDKTQEKVTEVWREIFS